MIGALAFAITVSSLGTALAVGGSSVARRYTRRGFTPMLAVLQSGAVVLAVLDLIAWARGHRPAEPTTYAAYLVASLVVVPLAALETRRDDGAWSAALLVLALVVLGVLVVRMQATWR